MLASEKPVTVPMPRFIGYVDRVSDLVIGGWVVDTCNPSSQPTVHLLINDQPVASAVCSQPRDDLLDAGFGSAAHGFEFRLRTPLMPRMIAAVQVGATDFRLEWMADGTTGDRPRSSTNTIQKTETPDYYREALLTIALHPTECAFAMSSLMPHGESLHNTDRFILKALHLMNACPISTKI